MSYEKKYPDWDKRIIKASKENLTAASAAASLGIKYDTYKKYAIKYGCFKTNQPGKGLKRSTCYKIPLKEILDGKHPQYSTNHLKNRLYKNNILEIKCVWCGITDVYNGKPIVLHLDHIDGNRHNHKLNNLRILCPNCHSQTDTWAGKSSAKNL